MKTKMMKRTLSTMIASTMALSLFAAMPAFAAETDTTETNEPRTYLFYDDFENDNVGDAPSNVYTFQNGKKYSDMTKTNVTVEYGTIMRDSTTTNTSKYLNFDPTSNNYSDIQMYLGKEGSEYNKKGTVVIEFDGLFDTAGNGYNNFKSFWLGYRDKTRKDGVEQDIVRKMQIMNHMSTMFNFTEEEQQYNAMGLVSVSEETSSGTNGTSVIRSRQGDYILARNNAQWNNYKIEINLENGECTIWLNGHIGKKWINAEANHRIGSIPNWGTGKLDSIVLRSDYSAGTLTDTTPWKLDNIKVYFKDTTETSPFGNITPEKNGKVNIEFGYAVNAEDVSIYNAGGEKINGTFVMSTDKKTATFTPDRIEEDGLYYVKLAKLASGTVTPQTTKEFDYAPGRTEMVISGLNAVTGTIAPAFTLTHTDGVAKDVIMILAAYKDGKLVKADVKTKSLTTDDTKDVQIDAADAPTFNLSEGEADTVKAFAWIGGTNVPICNAELYPNNNQ
mgnify:CR=1 FL=1